MNEIKVWNYEGSKVRTIEKDGEVWWVGKDVAAVLGYSNTRDALTKRVDAEDKMDGVAIYDSIGREQTPVFINESGLYSLILSSKLPTAKKFKHWVTSEVLPSIRKHGAYMTNETLEKALLSPEFLAKLALQLKQEKEKRVQLESQVETMLPKVRYYDVILQSEGLIPISVIAKDYGMSSRKMNDILYNYNVQYYCGNQWMLYQKYAGLGYTGTKTSCTEYIDNDNVTRQKAKGAMYWTQKGRMFLYEFLKKKGILPLMEKTEN